ncbi:hypothetical protein GGX14DRAFT_586365 [Mycena pura]|uniref:Uncharacterized protein n=1 Tax=Mycena pura TaxID=153505 RepID=A0AAD6VUL4_9AGAR|nr:hypothetical protein GGX14DRAFT_586365 [Mycena pura]
MPQPRRPLQRSATSTTHVSDSKPEREAKRRRFGSPEPAVSAARPPLASIQNTPQDRPRVHKHSADRVLILEGRVHALEKEVKELKGQLGRKADERPVPASSASPAPAPIQDVNAAPSTLGAMHVRQLLDGSLREMQAHDPGLYELPTPIRDSQNRVTRRLGHRTNA